MQVYSCIISVLVCEESDLFQGTGKFNLKLKKKFYIFIYKVRFQAGGWARKRSSLTTNPGPCRINLERRNMKDKTLIVKKKNVWGNELIYPVCQDAILFSCIARTKTFCKITIANIKKLGYKFETEKEEI